MVNSWIEPFADRSDVNLSSKNSKTGTSKLLIDNYYQAALTASGDPKTVSGIYSMMREQIEKMKQDSKICFVSHVINFS